MKCWPARGRAHGKTLKARARNPRARRPRVRRRCRRFGHHTRRGMRRRRDEGDGRAPRRVTRRGDARGDPIRATVARQGFRQLGSTPRATGSSGSVTPRARPRRRVGFHRGPRPRPWTPRRMRRAATAPRRRVPGASLAVRMAPSRRPPGNPVVPSRRKANSETRGRATTRGARAADSGRRRRGEELTMFATFDFAC